MGHMLLWGSALPHWGIHLHDDPGFPLNTAKLHTRHSCRVCDILCSCPRLPSRRLFFLFLLGLGVCLCLCCPAPVQFLPPSLRREKSGAQFFSCVLYGVSKASADVETQAKESILPTMVTKA